MRGSLTPSVYAGGSSLRQAADLVTAGPGPDLASLEDQSWRNKVSQQMQRIEPNLLVVLFQCTGVSPLRLASSNWLTQLVPRAKMARWILPQLLDGI